MNGNRDSKSVENGDAEGRETKPQLTMPFKRMRHQEIADERNDDLSTGAFPQVKKRPPRKVRDHAMRVKMLSWAMVVLLCALLGFGYVTQLQNSQSSYATLSEDELVRLLDETSTQMDKLEQQKTQLSEQLKSIQEAANKQQEVERIAKENEESSGILSGRLAAEGKGIEITISQTDKHIQASTLFTLIEELRNAGAEVLEFDGVRVVASTSILDMQNGVSCDGRYLDPPYVVKAIGNPSTLQNAVQFAGGVGSQLRVKYGAQVDVQESDSVRIDAVRQATDYQYAKTVE